MRTVIAPLGREVERELGALDGRLANVIRRYIRRLALEPYLGAPLARGVLATLPARRIYVDRDDHPERLLNPVTTKRRRGDQDLSVGPRWRIVYMVREARATDVRLVVVLAVGEAHGEGQTVYERAEARALKLERRSR